MREGQSEGQKLMSFIFFNKKERIFYKGNKTHESWTRERSVHLSSLVYVEIKLHNAH